MSVEPSLTAALGLGFVLGLRHAMDADHIAAVSALVSEQRSIARSCLLGTFWGAGHTTALAGAALATMAFRFTISPGLERGLEQAVAVMLVLLGGHVLLRSVGALRLHRHPHAHADHVHAHFHLHAGDAGAHRHAHVLRFGRRPFLVGLVHGLAGSGALMLLVLTSISSPVAGLLYVVLFGAGSTAGMLVLSGLIGIPFVVTATRSPAIGLAVQALAGLLSIGLGVTLLRA
jgi:ABC-type nickel/cobalt efflux system permease component RcnA